jgi:hypothetical protein
MPKSRSRFVSMAALPLAFLMLALASFGAPARDAAAAGDAGLPLEQVVTAHDDACGNAAVQAPDSGPSFNFHEACHAHDECYGQGGGEAERLACDRAFLRAMLAACDAQNPRFSGLWFQCRAVASLYYGAVRLGGWLFFYG